MKICVIGCGSHASAMHGPCYRQYAQRNPEIQLCACCDVNADTSSNFAQAYGFQRTYTNYPQMLERESPDAVGIVLPVERMLEITEQVLLGGFCCIIEKPPAPDREGVERLVVAAGESGSQLRVGFNRRFMPVIRALREQLTERAEPIRHINYEMHRVGRVNEDFSTTAIHGIDLVGFLGNGYQRARFTYQDVGADGQTATNFLMECLMDSDVTARLSFLPVVGRNIETVAVFTDSHTYIAELPLNIHAFGGCLSIYAADRLLQKIVEEGATYEACGFYNEIATFLDELRTTGINTQGRIETTRQSVELAHAIRNRVEAYS
ncbi:MAG: Gfo/Idh/MocA family oxidoreductase [Clostridia bacterium]|nr:Gfo/Idh/MocA family oxidoreductase [Clostridia bacterium]